MTRASVTVPPDCPVERALWLMRERKLRHVLVQDHERLVGILSERDLMEQAALLPRRHSTPKAEHGTEVRDRMSVSVETVTADESATNACRRLLERRISCLPVMHDGRLAGVLAEVDLLRLYVRVCRFAGHERRLDPSVESRMSREVLSVTPGTTVAEAFELGRAKAVRHLPVVHDGWLVGIVSDRDLLPVVGRAEGEQRRVGDVMTKDFVAVVPGTPLSEAAGCMIQNGFHALPVLVEGALKGILTSADVLATLCTVDEDVLESVWCSEEALSAGAEES